MNKPHIHANLIKKWADGATIQVKVKENEWQDLEIPTWIPEFEYRVKPEKIRFRLFQWCSNRDIIIITPDLENQYQHYNGNFITDWIEIDLI